MHVGIIMDGNGRWALARGLPRPAGHRAGAESVRRIVEAAAASTVDVLTLYAFSADNWSRPSGEVAALLALLQRYLYKEQPRCEANGVRVNVIGRRDRLPRRLLRAIELTEAATANGERLLLRLAVDYSARHAIMGAAQRNAGAPDFGAFEQHIAHAMHSVRSVGQVDLLIRTGGERRLSDFLLWECAYAELVFFDTFWPDFTEREFHAALAEFGRRQRRFGGTGEIPLQPVAV